MCFSNEPIHVQTYIADIEGDIVCDNEIKEAIWIDGNGILADLCIKNGIKVINSEDL